MKRTRNRIVEIRIREDPEIGKIRDIYDLAHYYRNYLPVDLKQGNRDEIRMTFLKKGELVARIQLDYQNGGGSIQYDIRLFRNQK
ncbi:MAG: hypothetical protein QXS38_01730 [Candidatus Pacearchaeota archaeon]